MAGSLVFTAQESIKMIIIVLANFCSRIFISLAAIKHKCFSEGFRSKISSVQSLECKFMLQEVIILSYNICKMQQQDQDHRQSNQHLLNSIDSLSQRRRSHETDQYERNSIVSEAFNEHHPYRGSYGQSNASEVLLIRQIRNQLARLITIFNQENNVNGLKEMAMNFFKSVLEKTEKYSSGVRQYQEFFQTESSQMINNTIFKNQRDIKLLMTQNQELTAQKQELKKHIKKIQELSKTLANKYKTRKGEHARALERIAALQRKNLAQKERFEEIMKAQEQNINILNETIKGMVADEVRNIAEVYASNIAELKHLFHDHQSGISLKNQAESVLPSPESIKLINKLTNSSETIQRRLKYLKNEIKRSRITGTRHISSNYYQQQNEDLELQALNNENIDSDVEFQRNHNLAMQHELRESQ